MTDYVSSLRHKVRSGSSLRKYSRIIVRYWYDYIILSMESEAEWKKKYSNRYRRLIERENMQRQW